MYKFQQPEDQIKFCLPLNRDTESLYYNTYLVIDANVLTEPRVFQISKINRSNSKGIAVFTCTQELANQHTLKADYDEDGNVTAWWADWNANNIPPSPAVPINASPSSCKIICSGKHQLKIGGSPKTLTVIFYDEEGNETTDYSVTGWTYTIDGQTLYNSYINISPVDGVVNKYKCTFLGDDTFIGKVITVQCISGDITASLDLEILPL